MACGRAMVVHVKHFKMEDFTLNLESTPPHPAVGERIWVRPPGPWEEEYIGLRIVKVADVIEYLEEGETNVWLCRRVLIVHAVPYDERERP